MDEGKEKRPNVLHLHVSGSDWLESYMTGPGTHTSLIFAEPDTHR